jgi:hypothetical protein
MIGTTGIHFRSTVTNSFLRGSDFFMGIRKVLNPSIVQ